MYEERRQVNHTHTHTYIHTYTKGWYVCRAVLQLYPETPQQMELITNAALKSGFGGGVVVDYPNSTKAKK